MAEKKGKQISVTCYQQHHNRPDWQLNMSDSRFELFFLELTEDLARLDIKLEWSISSDLVMDINSYADLLNAVRIASPSDGIVSLCVGHIIGKSQNLDLMADIKRAVNRVAFAPETIAPEDNNRRVCHNCGCGC